MGIFLWEGARGFVALIYLFCIFLEPSNANRSIIERIFTFSAILVDKHMYAFIDLHTVLLANTRIEQ